MCAAILYVIGFATTGWVIGDTNSPVLPRYNHGLWESCTCGDPALEKEGRLKEYVVVSINI